MKFRNYIIRALSFFIVFAGLILIFKEFLISNYNPAINHSLFNEVIEDVKTLEPLPSSFLDQINQVTTLNTYNQQLFNELFLIKNGWCPCQDIVMEFVFRTNFDSKILLNQKVMSSKYQRELTLEECLSHKLKHAEFRYNVKGVREASSFYFNKDLVHLTNAEVYALLLMTFNSSKYDIKKHPDLMKIYQLKFLQ